MTAALVCCRKKRSPRCFATHGPLGPNSTPPAPSHSTSSQSVEAVRKHNVRALRQSHGPRPHSRPSISALTSANLLWQPSRPKAHVLDNSILHTSILCTVSINIPSEPSHHTACRQLIEAAGPGQRNVQRLPSRYRNSVP